LNKKKRDRVWQNIMAPPPVFKILLQSLHSTKNSRNKLIIVSSWEWKKGHKFSVAGITCLLQRKSRVHKLPWAASRRKDSTSGGAMESHRH
jgi:hypothetical protein